MRGSSQAGFRGTPVSNEPHLPLVGIPRNTRENQSSEGKDSMPDVGECQMTVQRPFLALVVNGSSSRPR